MITPEIKHQFESVLMLHPKKRAKTLSELFSVYPHVRLKEIFQTDIQNARAVVRGQLTWPSCKNCGNPVSFFNDFAATCSKACAAKLGAGNRIKIQEVKNEEKIKNVLLDLQKNGVKPETTAPKLITEKVKWRCDCGHNFSAAIYGGTWLKNCPTCNRKKSAVNASTLRWAKWRENNPNVKWTHTLDTKNKIVSTNLRKYGVKNVSQIKEVKQKITKTFRTGYIENVVPVLLEKIKNEFNVLPIGKHEYDDSGKMYKWKHITCGHEFEYYLNYAGGPSCPNCRPKSKPEDDFAEWLKSSDIKFNRNNRSIIKPLELDFVIDRLAIEINGVYWHRDTLNRVSLYKKTQLCAAQDIHLLHFWDWEWINKKEICKSIVMSRLGLNTKIFARKCLVQNVTAKVANAFFERNHIHGKANRASYNYALTLDDEIVMVTSFAKPRFNKNVDWEIVRSVSKTETTIVGGFQKLLARFRNDFTGTIVSYSDNRFFDGASYTKSGFIKVRDNAANYVWTNGNKILSRYETQKHKLPAILKNFNAALTEEENMISNRWYKISDAGSKTWVLA